ncbi:DUF3025 domain-containing protein [Comamonas terrae]|uniref:DUF3025 domain-containing protein n=1 Tax=Comamonas terrae TaxID=673548 RepID=A0ABW5UM91_9BURK|nr:DUF3025 domain-containing protein [Comamonas terrae]
MAGIWQIDWSAPWLAGVRALGQQADALVRQGHGVARALQQVADARGLLAGWEFVPQGALPPGQAYEAFIRAERRIPTRDNLHDFFNGLIWLHWPVLKQHLNAMQAAAIVQQGVGAQRGPLRDAITVLDENGALLLAPQRLCEALRHRRWHALFVELRPLWAQACVLPIGHALLEKLVAPRKPITAHVICVAREAAGVPQEGAALDAWLSASAHAGACNLAAKPYLPLPVLGIPGWWPENENFSFYDDSLVFRAPRTTQAAQQTVQPA